MARETERAACRADSGRPGAGLRDFLASEKSPLARLTPTDADPDSVIDVRAVFQQGHRDLAVGELPPVQLPRKGRFGLIDYEQVFCPDRATDDVVLPLDAHQELVDFFAGILVDAR